jgi:eukaryotic-like serine/threonine-protein kinase
MGPADRLYLGDRIGNYRIEMPLYEGAMAAEYRAIHLVLPRRALLKVMRGAPIADSDQTIAVHMLREACMLDALQHPGIVRVYESGIHDKRPWFATELVEGPTIRNLLSPAAMERVEAIALLRDIAEILEHAFRRGVIHCGLRPERIIMTGRTRGFPVCIVDWSDARAHDAKLQQYTPSAAAWHYTSPELVNGDPIDDRTDVYALGVIAYQMLTGTMPFDEGIIGTIDDGTTQHVPTEILCPDAPAELCKLVDQMLAYDRWDRPSSTEVFTELSFLVEMLASTVHPRPAAAGLLRIRRPRWTPAIEVGRGPVSTDRAKTDSDADKPETE